MERKLTRKETIRVIDNLIQKLSSPENTPYSGYRAWIEDLGHSVTVKMKVYKCRPDSISKPGNLIRWWSGETTTVALSTEDITDDMFTVVDKHQLKFTLNNRDYTLTAEYVPAVRQLDLAAMSVESAKP